MLNNIFSAKLFTAKEMRCNIFVDKFVKFYKNKKGAEKVANFIK